MQTRRIVTTIAITGVAALLAGLLPGPADATHSGANGRIAFHRFDDDGFAQVWTANPDLTAAQQHTHGNNNSGWPAWAPDASRIAFDNDRLDPDPTDQVFLNDVFTMRPDGTDVRKLTDSVGFSGDASYSPDGTLVAFDTNRGQVSGDPGWPSSIPDLSIFVIGADGTGMRRVTRPPAGTSDTEPRFSPDGRQLVFSRFRGGHTFESGRVVGDISAVFTVNLDGTGTRRLTGWGHKTGQADWSPDGSRIVFEMACCRLGAGGVFTVPAGGGQITAVVNGHGVTGLGNEQARQVDGYYDPVWSPDGTKIIAGREFLDDDGTVNQGFVMVDADGDNLHWIATPAQAEHQPDWGTAPLQ
jgi:Tol biopolymer transport system component